MDEGENVLARSVTKALLSLLRGVPSSLDVESDHEVDGELRKLGETTDLLVKEFAEAQDFLSSLSKGRLDIDPPRRNFLISPFKSLHSSLRHLTWQTKQVAKGDLSQHVDFLGEFSDAFNTMIDSLREKQAIELALKRSEERLGLAIDGADLGLWDHDIGSGDVVFNNRFAKMLGYDFEETEARVQFWHDRIHPDDEVIFMEAWEEHLNGLTRIFRVEHRLKAKSGDWRWILCIGKIVDHDSAGQPCRFAGIFIDITDRRLAEAELEKAHAELLEANAEIVDSIQYARTIQKAFLPSPQEIASNVGDCRIIWRPKDVIGGDIYKFRSIPEGFMFSVIDCTGHGVPGAIMTMISGSCLDRALEEVGSQDPSRILARLNWLVKSSLNQHHTETESDDGLDIGICCVNVQERILVFAGARIGLSYISDGILHEVPADKQSIGYKDSKLDFSYSNNAVPIGGHTTFYMCTDGILHQTGGPKGLPFGKRRFKRLLVDNCEKPLHEQMRALEEAIEVYRGEEPQLDDITVIGFNAF